MSREVDEGRKPKPSIKYDYDVERWFPGKGRWEVVGTHRSAGPARKHVERIKAGGGVDARIQKTLRLPAEDGQGELF